MTGSLSLFSILFALMFFLASCDQGEPVATAYKKSYQAAGDGDTDSGNANPADGDGDGDDGDGDDEVDAALVEAGTAFYDDNCGGCHDNDAIAPPLLGQNFEDADAIDAARDSTDSHGSVNWPEGDDMEAVAAAFK